MTAPSKRADEEELWSSLGFRGVGLCPAWGAPAAFHRGPGQDGLVCLGLSPAGHTSPQFPLCAWVGDIILYPAISQQQCEKLSAACRGIAKFHKQPLPPTSTACISPRFLCWKKQEGPQGRSRLDKTGIFSLRYKLFPFKTHV